MSDVATSEPTRVSARRAQTRDRLLSAATTVFAARGIIGASVEEICEAAGFTRGAFYSNFAGKDELVLTLLQQILSTQIAAGIRATAAVTSAPASVGPEELVAYGLREFDAGGRMDRDTVLAQQELLLYAAREPALREPYLAFADECKRQFNAMLLDAMRSAGLEFTLDDDAAIELLGAAHNHVHLQSLFTGRLDWRLMQQLLVAIARPAD